MYSFWKPKTVTMKNYVQILLIGTDVYANVQLNCYSLSEVIRAEAETCFPIICKY